MKKRNGAALHAPGGFISIFFLAFVLFAAPGFVQGQERAIIYHAEGSDFSISLNNERNVFSASALRSGGIDLEVSGMVNTGSGTFLEIQLVPSGTVIKLSGNTSLIYNGYDSNGRNIDLGLLYGRIRVVTSHDAANPVVIHSGGVSARIAEGGDLGVDYFIDPDNMSFALRPVFRAYAFRGSVVVSAYGSGSDAAFSAISVEDGWSLSMDMSSSFVFAGHRPLDRDIRSYWMTHNFSGTSNPMRRPNTTIRMTDETFAPPSLQQTVSPAEDSLPVEGRPVIARNRTKNIFLAVGLALTIGSVVVQGISFSQFDTENDSAARRDFKTAYIPLGLGILSTLVGTLITPKLVYEQE